MHLFFEMYIPEDGHMSGRNMWEVYGVYNVLSYSYVHLLVFDIISGCSVRGYGSFKIHILLFMSKGLHNMTLKPQMFAYNHYIFVNMEPFPTRSSSLQMCLPNTSEVRK